jgi:hypothetical protein
VIRKFLCLLPAPLNTRAASAFSPSIFCLLSAELRSLGWVDRPRSVRSSFGAPLACRRLECPDRRLPSRPTNDTNKRRDRIVRTGPSATLSLPSGVRVATRTFAVYRRQRRGERDDPYCPRIPRPVPIPRPLPYAIHAATSGRWAHRSRHLKRKLPGIQPSTKSRIRRRVCADCSRNRSVDVTLRASLVMPSDLRL